GDEVARRLRRPHRPEPLGTSSEDVRDVRQRFDVVDQRGIRLRGSRTIDAPCDLPAQLGASGEEALLVGREHPRQGRLALDDLEHGLLLTEQVLVGPRHDRDRALPAYAGSLKLLDGPGHSLALAPEAAFDADER